ncbi:MAG: PEP/pyruvate-binding domain-containing protein [Nitrospirota bacterium]|nr:PEP/pyruvate-binding domain-containing protein [Nitrospirota bacterium]
MKNLLKIFKSSAKRTGQDYSLKDALKKKYLTFESLLRENNHVLMLMADMEEKLSGEYLFDRQYLNANVKLISDSVKKIVNHINVLSDNKYQDLYQVYDNIHKETEKILTYKTEIPATELVIPLENLNKGMLTTAGGKIAHLGEIKNRLNLLTPEGFSITAYAFKKFMEHNNFREKINEKLSSVRIENMSELNDISKEIQEMVIQAEIPEDLQLAIKKAVEGLKFKIGTTPHPRPLPQGERGLSFISPPLMGGDEGEGESSTVRVSVRSSAIHEDGEFSFAGQYATYLNVPEHLILQKYKEVVASLFTPRAIFYFKTKGFSEEEMVMAVGVLRMIDALAGGVVYSSDPNNPEKNTIIINAVWGLGMTVVDGSETPDSYVISKNTKEILEKKPASHNVMLTCAPEGDIKESKVPDNLKDGFCLTDEQIRMLSEYALMLEAHYGKPQDIEWAIDKNNQIYILQTRPLRIFNIQDSKFKVPRKVEGYNLIIDKGVIACKGIGYGKAFVLEDDEDIKNFPEGAVLVARHTSTKFVTVMNKASAIITDVGGATGHMASLAREYQVPTILNVETATASIKHGQEITVDAFNCNVYEGRVEELIRLTPNVQHSAFKETRLFTTLKKALKFIVPLNLVDPDNKNFKPQHCETFHDITRFCHEMAMAEIFKTGKGEDIDSVEDMLSAIAFAEAGEAKRLGEQTSALRAGIPVDAHLLDIDGGIRHDSKKVTADDITSVPFAAFLKGMQNMKWPGPRPVDAKGFFGMIAHTASIPEQELHKTGGKSYAIISRNYMNFSIRLGYHFSMVEAYAGENMNDNYIKFFFKGGGASTDRRLRRVRLIKEILKKLGFRVDVKEDVIDAMLTKYKQNVIEDILEVMGKLTAYTKQLDMAMYNNAVTDMFVEDFVRDHVKDRIR